MFLFYKAVVPHGGGVNTKESLYALSCVSFYRILYSSVALHYFNTSNITANMEQWS